jgi:O-acetyl-ADP-ribose deacetylase (regulator of RNase III)
MIKLVKGNLFDSKCDALVNAVNCVGVMGAGIAYKFKEWYPDMYDEYYRICKLNNMKIGQMHVFRGNEKIIINFPTKTHWKYPSKPHFVSAGIKDLYKTIIREKITSIAIPALGCGKGGLNWPMIKSIIVEGLSDLDCYIELYEPQ